MTNPIRLRQIEADVLEQVRLRKGPLAISRELGIPHGQTRNIISRLHILNTIERTKAGRYKVMVNDYEVRPDSELMQTRSGRQANLKVLPEMERYLRVNYESKTRSEMARELGIGRYELNMILVQLGIGS